MSVIEILDELPRLAPAEREKVWLRLEELEVAEIEETREMIAVIDAGRRSLREGKGHTVEEARGLIARWITRSS